MKQAKQSLSEDHSVYTNDFIMIRIDKGKKILSKNKPFERWDPQFWHPDHQSLVDEMKRNFKIEPLGKFIEYMTYGQVGRREYSKRGKVHYIQTINIVDTGIDYSNKLAFIKKGSWNDLPRSRLKKHDVLLGNSGMGGLGKVAIFLDENKTVNISQDIDILRIRDINPFYLATFLKSVYGNTQIWYHSKGVGAPKIPFDEVKNILIPVVPTNFQKKIEKKYLQMNEYHNQAIALREKGDESYESIMAKAKNMLYEILTEVEEILAGQKSK